MLSSAHRTNVVLDENIVQEALEISQIKTKRALIDTALKEFIAKRKLESCPNIRDLLGSKPFYDGYDYKALRVNPHLPNKN